MGLLWLGERLLFRNVRRRKIGGEGGADGVSEALGLPGRRWRRGDASWRPGREGGVSRIDR